MVSAARSRTGTPTVASRNEAKMQNMPTCSPLMARKCSAPDSRSRSAWRGVRALRSPKSNARARPASSPSPNARSSRRSVHERSLPTAAPGLYQGARPRTRTPASEGSEAVP